MKPAKKSTKTPHCEWGTHQWVDAPSKDRPGWIATYCKVCKKFLGRCPSDTVKFDRPPDGPGGTFTKKEHRQ